jgi:hypothetical protein
MGAGRELKARTGGAYPDNAQDQTMTMKAPEFMEALAIADSAAQKFVGTYPSREDSVKWRDYLRSFCVPGLRWLWRNGDHATRTTIAARVAVWRGRSTEEVRQLQERIRVRETGRKGGN